MKDIVLQKKERFKSIDQLRGIAVFLMIFYHTAFDLNVFKFIEIEIYKHPFWFFLPRLIVTLFLFSAGASLVLAHQNTVNFKKFAKRVIKILIGALCVSAITYLIYPSVWIYFGTLHAIGFISILALPFINKPWISFFIAILILFLFFCLHIHWDWPLLPHPSLDYIPIYPWTSVLLLGLAVSRLLLHFRPRLFVEGFKIPLLHYLGQHALLIYLIHQPLIYGIVFGIYKFTTNYP